MRKYLVVAGLACSLAATWALPTFADTGTGASVGAAAGGTTGVAGSGDVNTTASSAAITLDQLDVNKPFGDMAIDATKQPSDIYASLNTDQRTNLEARCNLIVPNADRFGPSVPTWCRTYLDWRKANHPNE